MEAGRPGLWGRYILLRDDDIDRADRWFRRHGSKAVFAGCLLPAARRAPGGLAASGGMA